MFGTFRFKSQSVQAKRLNVKISHRPTIACSDNLRELAMKCNTYTYMELLRTLDHPTNGINWSIFHFHNYGSSYTLNSFGSKVRMTFLQIFPWNMPCTLLVLLFYDYLHIAYCKIFAFWSIWFPFFLVWGNNFVPNKLGDHISIDSWSGTFCGICSVTLAIIPVIPFFHSSALVRKKNPLLGLSLIILDGLAFHAYHHATHLDDRRCHEIKLNKMKVNYTFQDLLFSHLLPSSAWHMKTQRRRKITWKTELPGWFNHKI